jgi:hypothetical protein
MYRCILTALTAGVILVAFALVQPMLPGFATTSLSGSAQAKTPKTNAINSNIYRKKIGTTKQSTTDVPPPWSGCY